MTELLIAQINVGQPRPLEPHDMCTSHRDREVISSFVKRPAVGDYVVVWPSGIVGDKQADTRVHGGLEMAIYAYPWEHLGTWGGELGECMLPGASFGENLTVIGATETEVCINDVYSCNGVLLCVTKPRRPCYKLARHRGDGVPQRMIETGRSGWYFSVLTGGKLPTSGGVLKLEDRPNPRLTVAYAFATKMRQARNEIPGPPDGE